MDCRRPQTRRPEDTTTLAWLREASAGVGARVRQLEGLLALQVLEPLDLQDLAGEDVDLSAQRVSGSGERDNGGEMASRYGAALLAMKFMYPW